MKSWALLQERAMRLMQVWNKEPMCIADRDWGLAIELLRNIEK